jgi:hypothetical protein
MRGSKTFPDACAFGPPAGGIWVFPGFLPQALCRPNVNSHVGRGKRSRPVRLIVGSAQTFAFKKFLVLHVFRENVADQPGAEIIQQRCGKYVRSEVSG